MNSDVSFYRTDVTKDNMINIKDLVRMKRFFAGLNDETHTNTYNDGCVWLVATDGDDGIGYYTPVGYNFYTNCHIKTDKLSDRYAYYASAYISTNPNPSVEFEVPTISVGITEINGVEIEMIQDNSDFIVPDNTIFAKKKSDFEMLTPDNSQFDCLFLAMMPGALIPLYEFHNTYYF